MRRRKSSKYQTTPSPTTPCRLWFLLASICKVRFLIRISASSVLVWFSRIGIKAKVTDVILVSLSMSGARSGSLIHDLPWIMVLWIYLFILYATSFDSMLCWKSASFAVLVNCDAAWNGSVLLRSILKGISCAWVFEIKCLKIINSNNAIKGVPCWWFRLMLLSMLDFSAFLESGNDFLFQSNLVSSFM